LYIGTYFSCEQIPKVVLRLETSSAQAVLRRLAEQGCWPPRHLFDLTTAYRILDYVHHGQSLFKSNAPSVQTMCEGLRLAAGGLENRLVRYYNCYLALRRLLAPAALDLLAAKTAADASIGAGAGDVSQEKQKRKELRSRWEVNTLHIKLVGGAAGEARARLVAMLEDYLNSQKIQKKLLLDLGKAFYYCYDVVCKVIQSI
jgi:hypothetical protein